MSVYMFHSLRLLLSMTIVKCFRLELHNPFLFCGIWRLSLCQKPWILKIVFLFRNSTSLYLLQNMFAAAQNENSGAVRKAYAATIAELAKYAPETRMHSLAEELVSLYSNGDDRGRFLAGQVAKECARSASEAFSAQASIVSHVHSQTNKRY